MTITHSDQAATLPLTTTDEPAEKVARMACCCKLSDLLPLVRQQLEARRAAAQQELERAA